VLVNAVLLHGDRGDRGSQHLDGHTRRIPPALLPQWQALVG
jgi:hypothetical protein